MGRAGNHQPSSGSPTRMRATLRRGSAWPWHSCMMRPCGSVRERGDESRATTHAVLLDRARSTIKAVLRPVRHDALLVSDVPKNHGSVARKAGHRARRAVVGHSRHKRGHALNINALSRLKGWMRTFNGVATQNLPICLRWRQCSNGKSAALKLRRFRLHARSVSSPHQGQTEPFIEVTTIVQPGVSRRCFDSLPPSLETPSWP
jgi:hypothetical protein